MHWSMWNGYYRSHDHFLFKYPAMYRKHAQINHLVKFVFQINIAGLISGNIDNKVDSNKIHSRTIAGKSYDLTLHDVCIHSE